MLSAGSRGHKHCYSRQIQKTQRDAKSQLCTPPLSEEGWDEDSDRVGIQKKTSASGLTEPSSIEPRPRANHPQHSAPTHYDLHISAKHSYLGRIRNRKTFEASFRFAGVSLWVEPLHYNSLLQVIENSPIFLYWFMFACANFRLTKGMVCFASNEPVQ